MTTKLSSWYKKQPITIKGAILGALISGLFAVIAALIPLFAHDSTMVIVTPTSDTMNQTSQTQDVSLQNPATPGSTQIAFLGSSPTTGISGKLVFLKAGKPWIVKVSDNNRFLVNELYDLDDLDGRIFELSASGKWLLFSRKPEDSANIGIKINSLWVLNLEDPNAKPIDLAISNVVHFATFVPGYEQTISYSTVEPRQASPGWQANNDLLLKTFDLSGALDESVKTIIQPNSGGSYGWWGTNFTWSPSGKRIAVARPDSVEILDINIKELLLSSVIEKRSILPLDTNADWALIPAVCWGADGLRLYITENIDPENTSIYNSARSPSFNLIAISLDTEVTVAKHLGMFSYSVSSPLYSNGEYNIAYLEPINPDQSDTSKYRLMVLDPSSFESKILFPKHFTDPGLEPQRVVWSPVHSGGKPNDLLAFVYQGNLWLINSLSGEPYQITSDGLTTRIDWE